MLPSSKDIIAVLLASGFENAYRYIAIDYQTIWLEPRRFLGVTFIIHSKEFVMISIPAELEQSFLQLAEKEHKPVTELIQ